MAVVVNEFEVVAGARSRAPAPPRADPAPARAPPRVGARRDRAARCGRAPSRAARLEAD